MSATLSVSPATARRFLVRAFALDGFQTLPDVASAVDRLESVQEDSINVCGRIHDLILWARVKDYAPLLLHDALYGSPRQAFEYYFPNLHVLPLADYPYFLRAMQRRATGSGRWHAFSEEELTVVEKVLARMDADGPLRTRLTGTEDGHTTSGWGTRTTVAARVTEKLWLHGRLAIARRENFERWFDRIERLLPEVMELTLPEETEETAYLMRKRLRTRRLFRRTKAHGEALGADDFTAVQIEGDKRLWHILTEDVDALQAAETTPLGETLHLLAPLDPLVYDRERLKKVFDFEYTWEVYVPAAKRRWGYYVLPILQGDRLIGRVDPKIDRRTGMLTLHTLSLEPGVDVAAIAPALAERLSEYARFLGATRITVGKTEPEGLRAALEL